jgi:hypothetical protein
VFVEVVHQYLHHQAVHRAFGGRDLHEDVAAVGIAFQGSFEGGDLAGDASDTGKQ